MHTHVFGRVKDLNANKDNPEAVKYHKLLCAKLEEIGNDLVAMAASLSYIFRVILY